MRNRLLTSIVTIGLAAGGTNANACRIPAPFKPEDVRHADIVIEGRIADYKIIRDPKARRERAELLRRARDIPPKERMQLASQDSFLSDYARFSVRVEAVLAGNPPRTVDATWDNSTFSEPASLAPGRYLIALRHAASRVPPLRGPSATILPPPDPTSLTVLQAPCAPAFLIKADSPQAERVRRALELR